MNGNSIKPLTFLLLLLIGHLHVPTTVRAQSASSQPTLGEVRFDEPDSLNLIELLKLGLRDNPELTALRAELVAAEARGRQAKLLPNPTVALQRSQSRDGMDEATMLEASVPLEINGARRIRIELAKREIELKAVAVTTKERDLAFELRNAYSALVTMHQKSVLLEKTVAFAENTLNLIADSVVAGKMAPLNESVQSVEVNRLRASRERAKAELYVAGLALRNLLGMDSSKTLSIRTELQVDSALLLTKQSASDLAAQRRVELVGARAVTTVAEARLALAKAGGRPELELMFGYGTQREGFGLSGTRVNGTLGPIEKEMGMYTFGLRITLPVFDRNSGEIAALESELGAARQRLAFGETIIENEAAGSVESFERAIRMLEILKVGVAGKGQENLSVVRESYLLGAISFLDFIKEQGTVLDIESEVLDARREAFNAQSAFLKAIGSPLLLGR